MSTNERMTWKDFLKVTLACLAALAGAEVATAPANWQEALSPRAVFGAMVALCGVATSWLANTPQPRPPAPPDEREV